MSLSLVQQIQESDKRLSLSLRSPRYRDDEEDRENFGPNPGHDMGGSLQRWEVHRRSKHQQQTGHRLRKQVYAKETAVEYEIPDSRREEFVKASMLPTHKLVIVTLAAVLGGQHENMEDRLQVYLASSEFKVGHSLAHIGHILIQAASAVQKNVVTQIRVVLLDPKLSSYKTGLLSRLMCHIRLNPATFRIPQEFRSEITTSAFNTAISNVTMGARSEMKRKMVAAWKTKTPIYDLVKALTWNSSQEMTDAIWARFAWIQITLVDCQITGSPADQFWDYIDLKLSERREEALEVPLANRPAFESQDVSDSRRLFVYMILMDKL
ncbi:hypothetical protein B0H10DRAFT_1941751 [Mycena sp. CBHHK59/15]|nr:hypothetical protein B0H10DRAFT_1941751 [Mycena sp. CBHHK59/15]